MARFITLRWSLEENITKAEAAADFEEQVTAPAIAEFRAGFARHNAIREASGFNALQREQAALVDKQIAVQDRIIKTPAVARAGLVAQLEFLLDADNGELYSEIDFDTIIAGVKRVAADKGGAA